jgi:hypothetical protein
MAETTIERKPRAMSPSTVHRGRNRLRAGLRYAVRGLAIAGLAGAAWLLSSSSANAAENDVLPGVLGAVTGDRGALALVDGLATGKATSLDGRDAKGREHAGTRSASTSTGLVTGLVTLLDDDADATRRGTVADVTSNLLAAVLPRSAPRTQQRSQEPIVQPNRTVRAPAARPASKEAVAEVTPSASTPDLGTGNEGAIAHRANIRRSAGTKSIQAPVGDRVERANAQGTHHAPLRPRPSPATGLGSGGAMSSGSGIAQDGGTSAFVPAAQTAGEAAGNRPDAAADVEVRLLRAESPTFSPD